MIARAIMALALIVVLSNMAHGTELFVGPAGTGSPNTCTSSGSPCNVPRVAAIAVCGDTITLLDGTYQGVNYMLDFSAAANEVCTVGNEITVRAQNEGNVFIDAQFIDGRFPFYVDGMSYWKFQGFDVGNPAPNTFEAFSVYNTTHTEFRRICASNVKLNLTDFSADVIAIRGSSNNLLEDMCAFGTSGNNILEQGAGSGSNTFRRIWTRWEGQGQDADLTTDCGGPGIQIGYGSHQTSTWENVITIYDPEQIVAGNNCFGFSGNFSYGSTLIRDTPFPGETGYKIRAWIVYGYNNPNMPLHSPSDAGWWKQAGGGAQNGGDLAIDVQDFFVDARSDPNQTVGPIAMGCASGHCTNERITRVTTIKGTSNASNVFSPSGEFALFTNINECTSLAACPNFYTGDTPGTGARNCFRYEDGTLTSTPLWPWPMDDRIKAALTRARNAGTGGSALAGSAGTGYAANTVTSEIVSRYGSVPTACLTGSSFTPSFPVASDFPSVSVRDDFDRVDASTLGSGWTELLGDTFDLVSNEASAAPTGSAGAFARAIYSDTKLQTSHEVYATWTTIAVNGATTTFLSFAGTDLTANNQYRVRVTQSSSANTMVRVTRVDGAGTETTILSDVDLGITAVDGNSFGVRVSGTTISVYWKWTDDIWYRVGEFTDSNLSTLPSSGVYGGIAGEKGSVINNFGAGPFVDQPEQEPPTPPASVGAGRFGTTFPGVR